MVNAPYNLPNLPYFHSNTPKVMDGWICTHYSAAINKQLSSSFHDETNVEARRLVLIPACTRGHAARDVHYSGWRTGRTKSKGCLWAEIQTTFLT